EHPASPPDGLLINLALRATSSVERVSDEWTKATPPTHRPRRTSHTKPLSAVEATGSKVPPPDPSDPAPAVARASRVGRLTNVAARAQARTAAAEFAGHAPSIHNTQPWHWRVTGDLLELYAEPARQLTTSDPDGRLMVLSCGTALHHARIALAAEGWTFEV